MNAALPSGWSNAFIGIPYADQGRTRAGADCWGLVRIVYQECLGITLPSYADAYVSAEEHEEVSGLLCGRRDGEGWQPTDRPAPLDLILFRRGRFASHVGIFERPGFMLHMDGDDAAKIVRLDDPRWASRLEGHWRLSDAARGQHVL